MNCQELRERMLDHSELDALWHAPEVLSHLDSCSECRERFAVERRMAEAFQDLAGKAPPAALATRIRAIPSAAAMKVSSQASDLPGEGERAPEQFESPSKKPPFPFWIKMLFGGGLSLGLAVLLLFAMPRTSLSPQMEKSAPQQAKTESPRLDFAMTPEPPSTHEEAPAADTASDDTAVDAGGQPAAAAPTVPPPSSSNEPSEAEGAEMTLAAARPAPPPAAPQKAASVKSTPGADHTTLAAVSKPAGSPPSGEISSTAAGSTGTRFEVAKAESKETWIPNPRVDSSPVMNLARAETAKDTKPSSKAASRATSDVPGVQIPPLKRAAIGRKTVIAPPLTPEPTTAKSFQEMSEARSPSAPMESPPRGNTLFMQAAAAAAAASEEQPTPSSGQSAGESGPIQCRVAKESTTKGKAEFFDDDAEAPAESEGASLLGGSSRRDWRNARLESILREHEPIPTPGPIDIDLWVLRKWLTVKERIELAPPRDYRWTVVRAGKTWEIALEVVPVK